LIFIKFLFAVAKVVKKESKEFEKAGPAFAKVDTN